ncbi:MAG: dihydroxy-acid dehydratase, partial [Desulfobacterales bacterium]|nr:dihydroxy-acid dehydratase [Desulfobacterales bacterium]
PLALIEDGDLISIDIPSRKLSVIGCDGKQMSPDRVNARLADRKKNWKRPDLQHTNGVLKRYARRAASAMKGAYLED